MKALFRIVLLLVLFVFSVSVTGFVGCEQFGKSEGGQVEEEDDEDDDDEDDDEDKELDISPSSVKFDAVVTNILFKASGGKPGYDWSVSDTNLGSVAGAGDTAVYTSAAKKGENKVIVEDSTGEEAKAKVKQK